MRSMDWRKNTLWACGLLGVFLATPNAVQSQSIAETGSGAAPPNTSNAEIAAVGTLLRQLQSQVQELSTQVNSLKAQQESTQAESKALRKELDDARAQLVALSGQPAATGATESAVAASALPQDSVEERVSKLEETQQLDEQKMAEQSQTKVESSSKYRIRLNGIVLFNTYINRGSVENQDFPELATPPGPLSSGGTFGASLRQSQIGLEGFGPTIAGARTSAQVQFDFAGGFSDAPNGVSFGIVRLRTGTVRFDWENTSLIVGQDSLFLAPLSPTSIATLAIPAFAYSGNLWSWTPQVRVEHHFRFSEGSSLLLQAGILDGLSGETPPSDYYRYPTWGENSGQPAYATRLAWTRSVNGQNIIAGVGGYYDRQNWGLGRTIDAWAGTADLTMPLTSRFEFTGQFYRGRATGGLGGGIAQSVLWVGPLTDPETEIYGLDSMGGWAQLKYKVTSKLQLNGAYGVDNPFASELRQNGGSQPYYPSPLSKNHTVMSNFLYQPKSDIVLSLEYRRLKTYTLDSTANGANIINISVGYLF
jgi:peptidoglycan hydrolase CwlO-like protein